MTAPIRSIGIVGAGTMGSGIALAALYQGIPVVLQDVDSGALERAWSYAEAYLVRYALEANLSRLTLAEQLGALTEVDLVIEAVVEDLAVKRDLFAKLDSLCPPPALLATNTSTLPVTAIAAATRTPERVAGFHFFNPAPVMALVELIAGAETAPDTLARLDALARRLEKTPIRVGDVPGFLVNRVARPFYGEAVRLLAEGAASPDDVDRIVVHAGGFRMGPFRLMDLIGLDVNLAATVSIFEQTYGESRYRPHPLQQRMVAQGLLGRKVGRGFYRYVEEEEPAAPPDVPDGGDLSGSVWISPGSWAPGLTERVHRTAGLEATAQGIQAKTVAAMIAAGPGEGRRELLQRIDGELPEDLPLLVQAADRTVAEMASWIQKAGRLVGFDGLCLGGHVVTLAAAPGVADQVRRRTEVLFKSLGLSPVWVGDSPGLVMPRILAMLANEAAFAVLDRAAKEADVDLAMQLGASYPQGPLAWARRLGLNRIVQVLEHLHQSYGEERYRVCSLLRRWAWTPAYIADE